MISIRALGKGYAGVPVLDQLHLDIETGAVTVILGPSGCGKTTLLRLIAGLERPDHGEIRIDGRRVSARDHLAAPATRGLGMVFQDLALWPHLRVRDQVAFGMKANTHGRAAITARVDKLLEQLAIADLAHRYPHQLSGGQRQRLAIARALAPGHPHLLMDEPFSNLDPVLKADMTGLVRSLSASLATTVLYVTHNLDEALALADRIVLMNHGRIADELDRCELTGLTLGQLMTWYRERLCG